MTGIRMFDYLEQYRGIRREIDDAIARVLESGSLILGSEGEAFEQEFRGFLGCEGFGVNVGSGTDAIKVALLALGIDQDDEVITVPNTAVPTVSAIRSTGAKVVFCDVDPRNCLMDLGMLADLVSPRTKAIVPVHLFGNVVDIDALRGIIGHRKIHIVEDCAQSLGSSIGGRPTGTLGDIGAFSFYPTKNLGAYGDAGLCFTRDEKLAQKMRMIRQYGFRRRNDAELEGINSRMDEIQAAILRTKLPHLTTYIQKRQTLVSHYHEHLGPALEKLSVDASVFHSHHLLVVKVADRERIRKNLTIRGIQTAVHYPVPIHLMKAYEFMNYKSGDFPAAESLSSKILSLPLYPELPPDSVRHVCDCLNSAIEQRDSL